ncbi:MAG TPA: hypothetical protein VGQ91_10705 [Ideonella sp.]|nr:hypothetical protein [Ideonella sp.]
MKHRPFILVLLLATATLAGTGCDKRSNPPPVNPDSPTAPRVPTPETAPASSPAPGASS